MNSRRVAGILWLIAGISSAGIAFFITDPLTLGVFIAGGVVGILLGLVLLVRPEAVPMSRVAVTGVLWLVAFGAVVLGNLSAPIEELLSVVWVLLFGLLGGLVAYRSARDSAGGT